MSARHRVIAGAPERSATAAATIIVEMLGKTLAAAPELNGDVVANELAGVRGAVRMLIAGKHLGNQPIVLTAEPLRLEITVVTGDKAASVDEKLDKVPGAATATDWMLHLPVPSPIGDWIADAVRALDHVTTATPPIAKAAAAAPAVLASEIDLDALRRAAGGGP